MHYNNDQIQNSISSGEKVRKMGRGTEGYTGNFIHFFNRFLQFYFLRLFF